MQTETTPPPPSTCYWLDADDRIVGVCGAWDRFARENDGGSALAADVVGRPVWRFMTGDQTRMWLDALLQRVRLNGKPIERPYRCDSPDQKRFMRMTISSAGSGRLQLHHSVLHTESIANRLNLRYSMLNEDRIFTRCSICNRLRVNFHWEEIDRIPPSAADARRPIGIRYDVCLACRTMVHHPGP